MVGISGQKVIICLYNNINIFDLVLGGILSNYNGSVQFEYPHFYKNGFHFLSNEYTGYNDLGGVYISKRGGPVSFSIDHADPLRVSF